MSIQQRLMAREPLDVWNVREQLCLASAVARSGDQNWMSVSRALRAAGDPTRPPDWYRQKSCAAQYAALLDSEATPKRKKRTSDAVADTPQETIVQRLTAERVSELQQLMQDIKSQYAVLKDEVAEVQSPATSDARVREMLSSVEAVRRQRERDQQRHALWLREREERRRREEKARRPLAAAAGALSPPAASPLLTSLLKSAGGVTPPPPPPPTQLLHIPHPSTVADTVSPSAGAPTLSMLLERGRESAPGVVVPPPPPPPPAPNETAVIEHIKSQLQEIEHNLRLGNMGGAGAVQPPPPLDTKVDIDDIEIKAEDVYAFSDMELEIPPVSSIHKGSLARCLEKSIFSKKDDEEAAPAEQGAELAAALGAEHVAAPEHTEAELVVEGTAAAAVEAPVEAEEAVAEAGVELATGVEAGAELVSGPEAAAEDGAAELTLEMSIPLPPEPEPQQEAGGGGGGGAGDDGGGTVAAPGGEPEGGDAEPKEQPPAPAVTPPLPSPAPQDSVEAEMQEMHAEAAAGGDATRAEPAAAAREDASAAQPPTPRDVTPVPETLKEEPAFEAEAEVVAAESEEREGAAGDAETVRERSPLAVKKEEEEWEAAAEEAEAEEGDEGEEAAGEVDDKPSEPEETHTETDDDTPMEVIREEEKGGRKRRDYSRRKASLPSHSRGNGSPACSGSESAADTSAPPSPAPAAPAAAPPAAAAAAADPERDHRLWRKSVMLVYNRLCAHKYASLFLRPITDEVAPDYSLVVRRPMDLHTIKRNIDSGVIRTTAEFQRDVLLMLSNALFYNNSRDRVHLMAQEMHEEAAAQLGMLLQAQAHAALADSHAEPPARRSLPHGKRKRTSSAGSPAPKRPRDD